MTCPQCGTDFTQAGNSDEGYVRSICPCDALQKCFRCKRGDLHPVNQALLDLDLEVRRYACAKHGHLEAESFPVPSTAPKPKRAVTSQPLPEKVPKPKPAQKVEKPSTVKDLTSLEAFANELSNNRDYVICLHCSIVQRFCDFKTRLDEYGLPEALCKRCGKGHAKATGKSW